MLQTDFAYTFVVDNTAEAVLRQISESRAFCNCKTGNANFHLQFRFIKRFLQMVSGFSCYAFASNGMFCTG